MCEGLKSIPVLNLKLNGGSSLNLHAIADELDLIVKTARVKKVYRKQLTVQHFPPSGYSFEVTVGAKLLTFKITTLTKA